MKVRLQRPRQLGRALRELARRRPREAQEYLDAHHEQWAPLVEANPQDAADILEALDEEAVLELVSDLPAEEAAEVLEEMHPAAAAEVLAELPAAEAADLLAEMVSDEAADIVAELDPEVREGLMERLESGMAEEVREILAHPPDSAGGIMTTEVAALPLGLRAGQAIEVLRRLNEEIENLSYVYVIDQNERLVGVVSFRDLVFARPDVGVEEAMFTDPVRVGVQTDREEVAELMQRYNFLALPVVDAEDRLVGMVTVDDVLDALQQEATEDIATMVGAGADETVYTPLRLSFRRRLPWIVVNFGTALLAAAVIGWFTPVIDRLTILAAYMPIVASMGGNGGAQSLAVVIRAIAVGDVPAQRVRPVIRREVMLGTLNGLAVALVSGAAALAFSRSLRIALVLALASLVNMVVAGFSGSGIPILLRRIGLDPALASNIILTTVTDVVGFGGFLAIAALFL